MKTLSLNQFRKKFNFTINRGMGDLTLHRVVDKPYYELDFDVYLPSKGKNLQRPLVWTLHQKRELVFSILKGVKLPVITVIAVDHKVLEIIDGKQRLSTLIAWYKGEFSIEVDGREYFFKDLNELAQQEFKLMTIYADFGYSYTERDGQTISDDDKIAWFEQINFAGTPQDVEHLKNLKS